MCAGPELSQTIDQGAFCASPSVPLNSRPHLTLLSQIQRPSVLLTQGLLTALFGFCDLQLDIVFEPTLTNPSPSLIHALGLEILIYWPSQISLEACPSVSASFLVRPKVALLAYLGSTVALFCLDHLDLKLWDFIDPILTYPKG